MASTLSQIIGSLNKTYKPQVDAVRQQQALIPQSVANEEQALQGKQTQAFDQILGGARQRGLGFSGIPLQEQAKYTSNEFLPALARLRQQGNEQKLSLEQAILGINERRDTLGRSLYEQQQAAREARRQFNLNYQLQKQAQADARASAGSGGGGGGFVPSFGGIGGGSAPKAPKKTNEFQQQAYNDVYTRINNQQITNSDLKSDYLATASSAKYGNQKDLAKLQIYRQLRPDLFGKKAYSWEK